MPRIYTFGTFANDEFVPGDRGSAGTATDDQEG